MSALLKFPPDPVLPADLLLTELGRSMQLHGGSLEMAKFTVIYDGGYEPPDCFVPDASGDPYCPLKYRGAFLLQSASGEKSDHMTLTEALQKAEQRGWL